MSTYELKKGNGQKPLWSQLYDVLMERINDHVYEEGGVLPSEAELMHEFSVSRITVRQAMDRLLQAGYISRRRGSGTVVLPGGGNISTTFRSSLKSEHNYRKDRRIISVSYGTVPPEVAGYFGISVNQPLLTLVRESFLDNRPAARYVTWLSPACMVRDTDDFSGSLYELLEQAGDPIDHAREIFTASLSTEAEKEIFGITEDTALIRRVRMGFSKGRPMEYSVSLYLSKDYELTIDETYSGNGDNGYGSNKTDTDL